jgi:hypothetical protein
MSKKIICILLLNSFSLHTSQKNPEKVHVDTMANLGKFIHDKKEKKTAVYKRDSNPSFSMHRAGPRIDSDPEQRKNSQEKK